MTTETKRYQPRPLTLDEARAVWAFLIDIGGARPDQEWDFIRYVTHGDWHEYRFGGSLGSGGKFKNMNGGHWYVTCYTEDRTPERDATIAALNAALDALRA